MQYGMILYDITIILYCSEIIYVLVLLQYVSKYPRQLRTPKPEPFRVGLSLSPKGQSLSQALRNLNS